MTPRPDSHRAPRVPLPSRLSAGDLAWRSVVAAGTSISAGGSAPDPVRIAAAYRSDRHLRLDGAAPEGFAPLSRFWRVADGWVRTHGNYPHHAAALYAGLGLAAGAGADEVARRLARMAVDQAVAAVGAMGGLCVPVRQEDPDRDAELRRLPLVHTARVGDGSAVPLPRPSPAHPLAGVRVLDLTRVIAGPVATRTLAFAGADVLRIDPPQHPELAWQHLDTGHGKRTALLDISTERGQFERLLAAADVIVLGYRPDGLRRLGLSAAQLVAQHPHLVVAQLSAWPGEDSPRGFDSLVQAQSGIAWIESPDGGETPGALPAQVLDHSAGYLLAAGIADALHRRTEEGGAWIVRTSLRRIAAELLGMPRSAHPRGGTPPQHPPTQTFRVGGHDLETVGPAVAWTGASSLFTPPRSWGADAPEW